MAEPLLVTVPNVELIEVGEDWMTSTGVFTFTEDDLASAVAAQDDPNIRTPVIKFGHTDLRFGNDGDFAVGRIENMRLSDDGMTLIGDYVGVPMWLAKVLPSAYPRRSIEGEWRAMSRKDQPTWEGFHLTAVALLGAYYPACSTLEDLETFWKGEDPPMYDADTGEIVPLSSVVAAAAGEDAMPAGTTKKTRATQRRTTVAAATQVEDVRRRWWDEQQSEFGYWAWIRAMYVDPPEIIVDDDDGRLFRQSFTIDGDEITFGEPEEVRIEYVSAGRVAAGARRSQEAIAIYATRDESNPATVPVNEPEDIVLTEENIRALGLDPASATEDEINAALAARLAEATEDPATDPATEPQTTEQATTPEVTVPEGMVLVDAATFEEVRAGAMAGRDVAARLAAEERDRTLGAAVKAGKFPRARLTHYQQLWDLDPEGTREQIAKLAPGLVPVEEIGANPADADVKADNGYPAWMNPRLNRRAQRGARITGDGALITEAQEA